MAKKQPLTIGQITIPTIPTGLDLGGDFSSSSDDLGLTNYFNSRKPKKPSALTLLQLLEQKQLAQKPHHSLLGRLLRHGVHGLESTLNVIARPSFAIAGAVDAAVKHEDIGHAALQGLEGKPTGFGQVLQDAGLLKHHNFLRGALGFVGDVVTDPVMLASVAAAPETFGASLGVIAAREAEMGVARGALSKSIDTALRGAADLSEARNASHVLEKAGEGYQARAALARARVEELHNAGILEKGSPADKAFQHRLHGLQAFAQAEHELSIPKNIALRYRIPFTKTLEYRTPFRAPSIARTAAGEGLLGKSSRIAAISDRLGKALKPGFGNEKFHALERVMSRTVEQLDAEHLQRLDKTLGSFIAHKGGLSEKEMLDALDVGERTPGIVKSARAGNARYGYQYARAINEKKLNELVKKGDLSPKQAGFLTAWHAYTEYLREADLSFGRQYDPKGFEKVKDVIYVPHIYTKTGQDVHAVGRSFLSKPGYEYDRLTQKGYYQSVQQLKDLFESGVYRNEVETNPVKLLIMRSRRGAQAQADKMMQDVIAKSYGVQLRVPNEAKLAQIAAARQTTEKKLKGLNLLHEGRVNGRKAQYVKAALDVEKRHQLRVARASVRWIAEHKLLERRLRNLGDAVRKRDKLETTKFPTAKQFLRTSAKDVDELLRRLAGKGKGESKRIVQFKQRAKAIHYRHQQARLFDKRAERLRPKSGATPHGSNYKRLVGELIKSVKPLKIEGPDAEKLWQRYNDVFLNRPIKPRDSWEARLKQLSEAITHNSELEYKQLLDEYHVDYKGRGQASAKQRQARSLDMRKGGAKAALDRHKKQWEKTLLRLDQKAAADLHNEMHRLDAEYERQFNYGTRLRQRLDKLDRQELHHTRSVRRPIPEGYTRVEIKAANGSRYAVPNEMAEALTRMRNAIESDAFLREFHRTWSKLLARWKVGVTVVNPGYRIRNTTSDLWNMWVSGVPMWAIGRYGTKAADLMQKALRHRDPEAVKLFSEAYDHGILSGLFQGDVEAVVRQMRGRAGAKELAKDRHFIAAYTRLMTTFNRNAENWGRLTHYLYRRQYEKLGPAEAARKVREAHFDYEDLTPAERAVKNNLAPFYTWTRKNIPYQISQLIQHPGRYSAFPKLANEMNQASGDNSGQIVPDWMKQNLAFHVPFGGKGNMFLPQFGPIDIEKVQHPKQLLGLLNPFLKTPIELATNKSLFTGAPIYGSDLSHPRNPISGFAAEVLRNFPGTDVGQTARQVGGKEMHGPGASPAVTYAAGQLPLLNFIVNQRSNIKRAQRGGGGNADILSTIFGISTFQPDQEAQIGILEQQKQKEFQKYIRGLRDQGLLPEASRKKGSFEKRKKKLIEQQYGFK